MVSIYYCALTRAAIILLVEYAGSSENASSTTYMEKIRGTSLPITISASVIDLQHQSWTHLLLEKFLPVHILVLGILEFHMKLKCDRNFFLLQIWVFVLQNQSHQASPQSAHHHKVLIKKNVGPVRKYYVTNDNYSIMWLQLDKLAYVFTSRWMTGANPPYVAWRNPRPQAASWRFLMCCPMCPRYLQFWKVFPLCTRTKSHLT